MKYKKIILFYLILLVLSLGFYYINSNRTKADSAFKNASIQVEKSVLKTQSIEIGEVTYKITPNKIKQSNNTWDFEVVLDTHTGSLEQDLVSLISIVDNKGNKYQAIKWVGDPPGGHHREGILQFSPIAPYPTYIEIKIQTLDTQEINTLRWNI